MVERSPRRPESLLRFFFSSRRRHTRSTRDWSSDVCSSDLSFTGKVHFSSTDANAVLPADAPLSGGTGSFTLSLHSAGNEQVTVSDPSDSTPQGSAPVTEAPAAASVLSLGVPDGAVAGSAVKVALLALDPYGNVATSYGGTVHFISSDPQAVLPADTALSAGKGIVTVTLKTAAGQTLTATDVALAISGVSSAITVTPVAASHFSVQLPTTSNIAAAVSITVTALDPFGNAAVNYNGTVQFSSTDKTAQLPSASTLVNGTGAFALTLHTLGNQTVTATDAQGGITASAATLSSQPFVAHVYLDLLQRPADAGGMVTFGNSFLQGQMSPGQIVAAIAASREYRS